jgi:hypothetical protein
MEDLLYVVNNSKYVKINEDNIDKFVNDLGEINYNHWSSNLDLKLTEEKYILLCFILESMNFCFWQKPEYVIEYKGELVTRSNAFFCAIFKEIENNSNFLDLDYLINLNKENFNKLFIGINSVCPLLEERYNNFKETINYMVNHDFYNELFSITNTKDLLKYIVNNFNSFNDVSIYKDKEIYFYKRATLLVNDLYRVSKAIHNNVKNVDSLRGCADYGIPRTFRDYNILVYNEELSNLVDNEIEIKHDSEMEIEIRANMLYVIELIKNKLNSKGIKVNSVELDNVIWLMGKKIENNSKVHHTVTIYY